MYCSPRDTRSRAPCDRLTVTAYSMNIMAEDWGLLPGEHVLFTPGHALQSTLWQTYCHRIYDVCVILHGQTSGAYYREHLRCLPRDAPLQRALRHACRQGTYCVLLTGYIVCSWRVDYWGHLSGNTHTRCSPRNTPLQSTLWQRYCHSTLCWKKLCRTRHIVLLIEEPHLWVSSLLDRVSNTLSVPSHLYCVYIGLVSEVF